jgi:hypothetical protein
LTTNIKGVILFIGGELMANVNEVFITKEVAEQLNLNPSYLIKLGKKIELDRTEMREAGSRNYLFSKEAIEKLRNHIKK